jgi:hypothetical protein
MFALIFAILCGVAVVAGAAYAVFGPKPKGDKYGRDYRPSTRWIGAVVAGIALILGIVVLGASMYSPVGTSDTGIVTSFGHTDGDLPPGIHWTSPWKNVTIWDHSVQRIPFEGKNCLEIRIAQQQSACLDVTAFVRTDPAAADSQFQKYKTFLRVKAALFSRAIITSFYNDVFERYNPVLLASQSAAGQTGGTTIANLNRQVLSNMRTAYANEAFVTQLNAGQIRYDPQIEAQLQKVVGATAGVNVAKENALAAGYQHDAAVKLATGNTLTPAVVEQNCINVTQSIIQAGGSLPPSWNCTGGGSGVIVNGTK